MAKALRLTPEQLDRVKEKIRTGRTAVRGQKALALGDDPFDTARKRTKALPADYGQILDEQCRSFGLPVGQPEVMFHPKRRWRFDRAWPDRMLALEIEGGIWTGGRHVRGKGFEEDLVKYAEALCLGWRVLRVSTDHVKRGKALDWLRKALNG